MRAHGWSGYLGGCRCEVCRAANTEACRRSRASRYAREIPPHVPHGTQSTYGNWGCRCPECSVAHADYCAEYKRTRERSPEQRKRDQQTHNARLRERYQTDPEYREQIKARNREAYASRRAR